MKKIIVTGGSRGIGFAIAQKLCELGHKVTITGRDEQRLINAAKEINAAGYIVGDLTRIIDIPEDFDILINNAGAYIWSAIENTKPTDISNILKLNLQVPIELCALLTPNMKANKWGRIINIGSISGAVGEANAALYSASKAGLIGLTKALALELAEHGITVNIINPGWVKTDMSEDFLNQEQLDMIPQKRYIEPYEVAELVAYLISDSASAITGQSLNMCCGLSLG